MSKLTLSFKGKTLRVLPVQQGTMLIGSDDACPIHIDSLAVQPQHARIETHGNDSILFDNSNPEGTFVNQERISEHKLKDGDIIRVGKHNLSFTYEEVNRLEADESSTSINIEPVQEQLAEASATAAPAAKTAPGNRHGWLQILNGQNLGKTLSLNRSMTNLGKPGVATAVITRRNHSYFISHLEGKHTPKVGDSEIGEQSVELHDGDTISIGNVRMQFYLE